MEGLQNVQTKGINTRQLIAYAKENGFNSVKFSLKKNGQHTIAGKFLDAYYEFVQIPLLGNGFVRMDQLEGQLGYDITFDVLTDKEFTTAVTLDFLLRGKEIPKEYMEAQKIAFGTEDDDE